MSRLQARLDDVRLAFGSLTGHKLRAGLTLLGIVIGVFTVVSMMALTTGLQNAIDKGLGGLGANVFQLQKWPAMSFGPASPEVMKRKNLLLRQALALRDQLTDAEAVGAEVWDGGKELTAGSEHVPGVGVAGGTAEFFTNNDLAIAHGRGFGEGEATSVARVILLGAATVDALFPGDEPLGKRVRLGRMDLEVIGVLERQGSSPLSGNRDNLAVIPIGLFFELYGGNRSVNITVRGHEKQDLRRLQDQAVGVFRRIRGLDAQQDNDFDMYSNDSIRATFDELAGTVSAAMLAICALSLLVGGIGVMNIMLVAVAERTREIGLRKALGARRSRILLQFVAEAVLLGLFGGVIGVALGYAASALARFGAGLPTDVPGWSVALSLGVSCGIGLVFGIYPAAQAAKLDPAVALRVE